jgi:hypothetical protein
VHHGKIYFVECKLIVNSLLIRMVGDSNSAISDRINEVFDNHLHVPSFCRTPLFSGRGFLRSAEKALLGGL